MCPTQQATDSLQLHRCKALSGVCQPDAPYSMPVVSTLQKDRS
jgi:hypothetical protein